MAFKNKGKKEETTVTGGGGGGGAGEGRRGGGRCSSKGKINAINKEQTCRRGTTLST